MGTITPYNSIDPRMTAIDQEIGRLERYESRARDVSYIGTFIFLISFFVMVAAWKIGLIVFCIGLILMVGGVLARDQMTTRIVAANTKKTELPPLIEKEKNEQRAKELRAACSRREDIKEILYRRREPLSSFRGWLMGSAIFLLENKYIDIPDGNGETALIHACRAGHSVAIPWLMKHGAIAKEETVELYAQNGPVRAALEKGRTEATKILNEQDPKGNTVLMRAVMARDTLCVRRILNFPGVKISLKNKNGYTALQLALFHNVRILKEADKEANNDPNAIIDALLKHRSVYEELVGFAREHRWSPSMILSDCSHTYRLRDIVPEGNPYGEDPENSFTEKTLFKILKIALINLSLRDEPTPLIQALREGKDDNFISDLIQTPYFDLKAQKYQGMNALMVAAHHRRIRWITELRKIANSEIYAPNAEGDTVLSIYIKTFLAESGPFTSFDPTLLQENHELFDTWNIKNQQGDTALSLAKHRPDIQQALLNAIQKRRKALQTMMPLSPDLGGIIADYVNLPANPSK